MQFALSPETLSWLDLQVRMGQFASYEEAIDYSVKLTSLRETLLSSIADPRRLGAGEVRENLKAHFAQPRAETGSR